MLNDLESSLSPMGHHAIDKDAAIMMRMNKEMMSTLPASSFLPCLFLSLLLFSFPLATRSGKTWISFLALHCKEYTYRMTIGERKVVSYSRTHVRASQSADPWRGDHSSHSTDSERLRFSRLRRCLSSRRRRFTAAETWVFILGRRFLRASPNTSTKRSVAPRLLAA